MMKLRVRSLESRETRRIEVPIPSSVSLLKQLISSAFSPSSPPPDSIHISLNRKDEIRSSSPDEEALDCVGITSGDLIYFTVNPNGFSPQTLVPNSQIPPTSVPKQEAVSDLVVNLSPECSDLPGSLNLGDETQELAVEEMEIDSINDEVSASEDDISASFSAPGFLRKVFTAELGSDGDGGGNHKLVIVAIHAVLLESGFVGFDIGSRTEIRDFHFRNNWSSKAPMFSLFYTLPGIVGNILPSAEYQSGVVVLKFQSIGKFLNVYGALYCGCTARVHSVHLNEDDLVPFLNVAWANCGLGEKITSKDGVSVTSPESEVFNFWRIVKDKLALPLLIDLCDKAGLVLPPCFMRLPTDLKLKILESLSGDDVAKVSCVCSELRYLASNDDLWKLKFVEEFGDAEKASEGSNWKGKFARRRENRKKRLTSLFGVPHLRRVVNPRFNPNLRFPSRPGIIGGDYDLFPQPGVIYPFRQVGSHSTRQLSPSHIPRCNLGGL